MFLQYQNVHFDAHEFNVSNNKNTQKIITIFQIQDGGGNSKNFFFRSLQRDFFKISSVLLNMSKPIFVCYL